MRSETLNEKYTAAVVIETSLLALLPQLSFVKHPQLPRTTAIQIPQSTGSNAQLLMLFCLHGEACSLNTAGHSPNAISAILNMKQRMSWLDLLAHSLSQTLCPPELCLRFTHLHLKLLAGCIPCGLQSIFRGVELDESELLTTSCVAALHDGVVIVRRIMKGILAPRALMYGSGTTKFQQADRTSKRAEARHHEIVKIFGISISSPRMPATRATHRCTEAMLVGALKCLVLCLPRHQQVRLRSLRLVKSTDQSLKCFGGILEAVQLVWVNEHGNP
mmetsp:Transcript_143193/g.252748  ORF Transcript_143193/g.252748 Transcript_143193/m.252748 type:complete len:275 (-) Transcript_143193:207-1031(-)